MTPAGPDDHDSPAPGQPAPSRNDDVGARDAAIRAVPGTEGQASAAATIRRTDGGGRGQGGKGRDGRGRGGRRRRGRAEEPMVPEATFTSYYGRPVVKAVPWEADIPFYLFTGGVAAGSSLLAAGADLSGRAALRRGSRIAATAAVGASLVALVHDLGRPERFLHMLRVFKPTSPMSVGTWILTAYGPGAVAAGAAEIARLLPIRLGLLGALLDRAARPAGLAAAALAPALASYTAVLLSDTSTPAWHDAHRELPFVFAGSAAAASGGLALVLTPTSQTGPARALAAFGAVADLVVERRMEQTMGLSAETLHTGTSGALMRASTVLTATGAAGAVLLAGRSRAAAVLSGAALLAGSVCTRFGVFEAGQASVRDPKYTVVPQRERLNRRRAAEADGQDPGAAPTSRRVGAETGRES